MFYIDGQVLGLSEFGTVLQWNGDDNVPYDTGETLDQWGVYNLRDSECECVGVTIEERDLCAIFDDKKSWAN